MLAVAEKRGKEIEEHLKEKFLGLLLAKRTEWMGESVCFGAVTSSKKFIHQNNNPPLGKLSGVWGVTHAKPQNFIFGHLGIGYYSIPTSGQTTLSSKLVYGLRMVRT